jgi:diadenylate cyclase
MVTDSSGRPTSESGFPINPELVDQGDFFSQLSLIVRIADIIDVLLVAIFLFIIISWLRQSSSRSAPRRVVVVGLPLVIVYFLADTYDLVLVESLVQVLIYVLLLALVVVFQSDLRRLLDRIGALGFRRPRPISEDSETVNNIAAAAGKLASTRTGALIAIRGSEPWDSHVQGGIELGGVVSRPLLYSIFAPDTPGHDGAVLVEGDRVTAFGVHLPLSSRPPAVSHAGGTRHAAALGLSEECDAMVIVVSEESGTISVARDGELTPVASARELRSRIDEFWDEHYRGKPSVGRQTWARRRLENAVASLLLAIGAWFLFVYNTATVQRSFVVPVAFRNVPQEWVLDTERVPDVRVVLSGPETTFRTLNPADLVITFDLPDPVPGDNELAIRDQNLAVPSDLTLSDVDPPSVSVLARRYVGLDLPVVVRTVGELPDSLALVAQERSVTVFVPEGTSSPPDRVPTQAIDLSRVTTESDITVPLLLPTGARLGRNQETEIVVEVQRRPVPLRP